MSNRYARCLGFACTLLAAVSCGSDSDSSGPSATVDTPASGAAGTPGAPAGDGATPSGEAAPGESPNSGLDDAPLDGASTGGAGSNPDGDNAAAAAEGGAPPVAAAGAGGAANDPTGTSPFPASVTRPKIMIVGDSISAGPGCYKKYLLADLNTNGYTNFDFVGQYTDDCGGGVMHSARSCTTALDYTQPTFTLRADCHNGGTFPGLATLMTTFSPDLLMLQLGVNDVWNGLTPDAVLANYATLLQQARAQNPNVVIAIAQIQQIRPMGDANADAVFMRAQALIEALPAWAQAQSQPTSPVFVADLWTNSDVAETKDGVHPTDVEGSERMGGNWFEALRTILQPD